MSKNSSASQNPVAFGLDLHWMAHVQGALAIAEIIKRVHPKTPVLLGGLSATYYHEEILRQYPFIDFVVRGDSTEKPFSSSFRPLREIGISKTFPISPGGMKRTRSGSIP